MPVEIRELVIKTNIHSPMAKGDESLTAEKLAALKQQIVQECLRAMKERVAKRGFER